LEKGYVMICRILAKRATVPVIGALAAAMLPAIAGAATIGVQLTTDWWGSTPLAAGDSAWLTGYEWRGPRLPALKDDAGVLTSVTGQTAGFDETANFAHPVPAPGEANQKLYAYTVPYNELKRNLA
jgi:hypothetical protein